MFKGLALVDETVRRIGLMLAHMPAVRHAFCRFENKSKITDALPMVEFSLRLPQISRAHTMITATIMEKNPLRAAVILQHTGSGRQREPFWT